VSITPRVAPLCAARNAQEASARFLHTTTKYLESDDYDKRERGRRSQLLEEVVEGSGELFQTDWNLRRFRGKTVPSKGGRTQTGKETGGLAFRKK